MLKLSPDLKMRMVIMVMMVVVCVFLAGGGVASQFGPNMTMKRLFCDDKAFCLIFNKRLLEFDAENLFVLARWRH